MKLNVKIMRTIALAVGLAVFAVSCASVPDASPEMKQQALSFSPPPNMAGLYVIRPYHIAGSAVSWVVRLDYQDFGSLGTSSYLYSAILPGKHFIRMGKNGDYGMETFMAEAGKNYYFTMKPSLSGHIFDQVSETEGQQDVRDFKMSGASSYKVPFNP
jgi:hypothetical protein